MGSSPTQGANLEYIMKYCLILGMIVVMQGERPRDDEQYGGLHNSMNECQLVGKKWRQNVEAKHAWTVCAPEGNSTYKRCEKLNEN